MTMTVRDIDLKYIYIYIFFKIYSIFPAPSNPQNDEIIAENGNLMKDSDTTGIYRGLLQNSHALIHFTSVLYHLFPDKAAYMRPSCFKL